MCGAAEARMLKDLVMRKSTGLHCLFCVWMIFFSPGLVESSAVLDYGGSEHTPQLEALKAALLELLGMDRPPESREKTSQQNLFRLYQQYRNLRRNMQHQKGSSLLLFTKVQTLGSQRHRTGPKQLQWFRAAFHRDARLSEEFTLGRARLQLHTRPADHADIPVRIHINSEAVQITDVFRARIHNVTVDVTTAVEKWLAQTDDALLIVDIGLQRRKRERHEDAPQLHLELERMEGSMRRTRSANEDDDHCGLKSLQVSFEEIGWSNWIVAPSGYTMSFCEGSCPHNYKPASMHTQVKSRLHRLTKGATPRPCCVPAAYDPLVLMHYDSRGKLKVSSFDDLIVRECYCA